MLEERVYLGEVSSVEGVARNQAQDIEVGQEEEEEIHLDIELLYRL